MKQRLSYLTRLGLFWVSFFIFSKALFLVYHYNLASNLSAGTLFGVFIYGLRLDLSMTGYLLVLPIVVLMLTSFSPYKWVKHLLDGIFILQLMLVLIIIVADLEIYKHWGFHMDKTPLLYLKNPKEAFASVSAGKTVLQTILIVVLFLGFYFLYRKVISKKLYHLNRQRWYTPVVFLFILAFMFVPIRGSFGVTAVNLSSAYFSEHAFANHAAINEPWNFAFSLTEKEADHNPYHFYTEKEADILVSSFHSNSGNSDEKLSAHNPNILLIITEAFSSKNLEIAGGWKGVAPNMDKLARENIYFENFYANGDRTDKGLVAILGSFPAQPSGSIIKFPQKTAKLPHLGVVLAKNGYYNYFYYGGDVNFANMRAFLNTSGITAITDKYDFPSNTYSSKWGVHDHVLLDSVQYQLKRMESPFFTTVLTLSSHEPFDVPHTSVHMGEDEFSMYKNAVHYTDSCLGDFIAKARQSSWWDSTLIIITADHGTRHPRENPVYHPENFHIPMIWTGGALDHVPEVISTFGSQTDIASTVLNQLKLPADQFRYSRNLLSDSTTSLAFYAFNEGFGIMTDSTRVTLDLRSDLPVLWKGTNADSLLQTGKAYLQWYYDHLVAL